MLLKNNLTQSILNWFTKKKTTNNDLSKILINNILIIGLIKPLNIILNFATFTLCIRMVLKADYGLFLTVNSFVSWFSIFDLGIGNGLRNHLTLAIEQGDELKAKKLVSTAYFYIGCIFGILLLLFFVIMPFVDWAKVFNTAHNDIFILVLITVISFVLRIVLQLITTVLLAYQQSGLVEIINILSQFLILVAIYLCDFAFHLSLVTLSFIICFIPIFVLFGFHIYALYEKKIMMPVFSAVDKNSLKDIFQLGIQFFLIQIAGLVIFSLNNFMINSWFNAEMVTEYNIAFKYYTIPSTILTILLVPYWSLLTKALGQNNFGWIESLYKKTILIWGIVVLGLIGQYVFSNFIYKIWLGKEIHISSALNFSCLLYGIIFNWNAIQATFLNGMGKVKLQLYVAFLGLLIFLPASYILSHYFAAAGIVLASCVCLLGGVILCPIQIYKLIRNPNSPSKSIWNT